MTAKPFLFVGLVLIGCVSSAVSQPVPNPTDTSYVMELLKKGEAIETKEAETALKTYRKAFEFSKKINYTKGYFETVRLFAYLLNNLGRHDEAKKIGQAALQKALQDSSTRNLSISYFVLANTALFSGDFNEAIPNYQRAAYYMRLLGKMKNLAVINQNLGHIYEQQRLYPRAVEFYKKALDFDKKDTADRRSIAIDYFSIGTALSKQDKKEESKANYLKARKYVDPAQDLDFMINLYNNLGQEYSSEAVYDSAMYYLREALIMSRKIENARHEMHVLITTGQVYNQMKQYKQATVVLNQANGIASKNKFWPRRA